MWWILRRARLTGASFFSQSSGTNNNNTAKPGQINLYKIVLLFNLIYVNVLHNATVKKIEVG